MTLPSLSGTARSGREPAGLLPAPRRLPPIAETPQGCRRSPAGPRSDVAPARGLLGPLAPDAGRGRRRPAGQVAGSADAVCTRTVGARPAVRPAGSRAFFGTTPCEDCGDRAEVLVRTASGEALCIPCAKPMVRDEGVRTCEASIPLYTAGRRSGTRRCGHTGYRHDVPELITCPNGHETYVCAECEANRPDRVLTCCEAAGMG